MTSPVVLIGTDAIARAAAQRIAADDDARAEYECGLLNVPADVESYLRPLVTLPAREYGGGSYLLRGDDEPA